MKLNLTPCRDDDDFGGKKPGLFSRVDELSSLFAILYSNVNSSRKDGWRGAHHDVFEDRCVPGEDEREALLWHLVFSALVQAVDEVSREVFFEGGAVPQEGLSSDEVLGIALGGMTEPAWREPIVGQRVSLEDLLPALCGCYGRWQRALIGDEGNEPEELLEHIFFRKFRYELLAHHRSNQQLLSLIPASWNCADSCFESWLKYLEKNQIRVKQPIPGESFSLEDIYVDLRGVTLGQKKDDAGGEVAERKGGYLADSVLQWLRSGSREEPMIAIVGESGSGKSSFCDMFVTQHALDLYKEGISTFHVSAGSLTADGSLPSLLVDYFSNIVSLNFDPLGESYLKDHRVLLILDDLEKLWVSTHQREELLRRFIQNAFDLCSEINRGAGQIKLQMLFTGHPETIRSSPDFFYGASLLEILPFYPGNKEAQEWWPKEGGKCQEGLQVNQRQQWWERWSKLTGEKIPEQIGVAGSFGAGALAHQPFFNYVIAHAQRRVGWRPDQEFSLQGLYLGIVGSILEAVNPRGSIQQEEFLLCFEELAVWISHGESFELTVSEIHQRLNQSLFIQCVAKEEVGWPMAEALHSAIQLFFFADDLKTVCSNFRRYLLGDYLVASRLVRIMRWLCGDRAECRYDKGSSCKHSGLYDDLLFWTKMTASVGMNVSTFTFFRALLKDALENLPEDEQVHWQFVFSSLFSYAVTNTVPIDQVEGYPTYRLMNQGACHAETALVVALGGIAVVTKRVSPVEWKESEPQALGSWLMKMNGQHVDYLSPALGYGVSQIMPSPLILDSLSYLNFSHQILTVQNLASASLEGAMLTGVSLSRSSLRYADLRNACMDRSLMCQVTMDHANLCGANLDYTELTGSRMEWCQMSEASLIHAILNETDLSFAKLNHCAFSWAKLNNALLRYAVLDDARMNGAAVNESSFRGASLVRCSLDDVTGSKVIFDQCNLDDASLIGGILNEGSFSDATLHNACLYRAELKSANFLKCQMSGVNLEASNLCEATFRDCDLQGASLNKADLAGANFEAGCSLHGASLSGVLLHGAVFQHVDFRMAVFEKSQASGETQFIECDLSGADFNEVDLGGIDISGNQLGGVIFIGARLKGADLTGADLCRAVLDRADFSGAVLKKATMDNASLFQVNLKRANLSQATLRRANLHGADLEKTDLSGVDFSGASLFGASLVGADLEDANLSEASLFGANFEGARLRADQLTEEQKEQMRGAPDWIYSNEVLNDLHVKQGDSLDSLMIVEVKESVIEDGDLLIEECEVSSVTSSVDDGDNK